MIPFVAAVGWQRPAHKGFRLWIPLIFVWLLLLPIVLLLLPFAFAACVVAKMNPFRTFAGLWRVLTSLGGTDVEIVNGGGSFSIRMF